MNKQRLFSCSNGSALLRRVPFSSHDVGLWPGIQKYGMDVAKEFLKSNNLKAPGHLGYPGIVFWKGACG